MRKNHLRHYTLVPHVYIGFALSLCNRLQELTATMVTPRNTVPMETCPSFRNDFSQALLEVRNWDTRQKINVWFSRPMGAEVTCRHRKSRVVSDWTDDVQHPHLVMSSIRTRRRWHPLRPWTHWDQANVLNWSLRNIAIAYIYTELWVRPWH